MEPPTLEPEIVEPPTLEPEIIEPESLVPALEETEVPEPVAGAVEPEVPQVLKEDDLAVTVEEVAAEDPTGPVDV